MKGSNIKHDELQLKHFKMSILIWMLQVVMEKKIPF